MINRIIIAYACENKGSEPGVGYYWTKAISDIFEKESILLITRKNNDVSSLFKNKNLKVKGIDLNRRFLFLKKILGVRIYYFIWQFLVFIHLLFNHKNYKNVIIHQLTFTPMYFPPIFFILPYKFVWGPIGGGESFPIKYLSAFKIIDIIKELLRLLMRYSIYINPLFYAGCINSTNIICSSPDSANMIPKIFHKKVSTEIMVFDEDKEISTLKKSKTIVIANRLIDWKMTHLFVQAFYEFTNENKTEYTLTIIGDGPYYDKIKPFLENKNIFHFKRFEHREDMLSHLKKASLFVSMSLHDSGAASLLEAMSYGVPFFVTNTGAHKVYLNKKVGFSFDLESYNDDLEKIKLSLKKLLNDDILSVESDKIMNCYNNYFREEVKIKRIKTILDK
ncbi:glycosyltransferase [Lutibacter citreus]|uniref:glycosyltransferase n=1 Tax=Lutibacter citreus TaxID=2138210 RepID=UPI000DBE89E7|nr:glycosyltransferase [Lutibacter citreus]